MYLDLSVDKMFWVPYNLLNIRVCVFKGLVVVEKQVLNFGI